MRLGPKQPCVSPDERAPDWGSSSRRGRVQPATRMDLQTLLSETSRPQTHPLRGAWGQVLRHRVLGARAGSGGPVLGGQSLGLGRWDVLEAMVGMQ